MSHTAENRRDARAAAREKAHLLRSQQNRRDRRKRMLITGGIIGGVVAVALIVTVVIATSIRPVVPGPKNMASDGILIQSGLAVKSTPALAADAKPQPSTPNQGGGVVDIRIYADYLCPLCAQFAKANLEQLKPLVKDGAVTVEFHPVALYTGRSAGTQYSLRAANAAACVANYSPGSFWNFNATLFQDQPQQGTPGLSDSDLIAHAVSAGSQPRSDITACINDGRFTDWVNAASDRALSGPLPNSTVGNMSDALLVLVNGKPYKGSVTDADDFKAFVIQTQGEEYSATTKPTAPAG